MIELRRLHAFVVVAEEGHVTRAAESLGMRQPPLGQRVKALEGQLGLRPRPEHSTNRYPQARPGMARLARVDCDRTGRTARAVQRTPGAGPV